MLYKRGNVHLVNLEGVTGNVQKGMRPCVIVQNDTGNKYSPTVIICTFTTKVGKRGLPTHVKVTKEQGVAIDSDIQTEQILTVNKSQLSDFILCELSEEVMKKVDDALMISLGINKSEYDIKLNNEIIEDVNSMIEGKRVTMRMLKSLLDKLTTVLVVQTAI